MNVFCITFSVTHSQRSQLTLQVTDSTGFHASKLVNNAGEFNRIEFPFLHSTVPSCLTCFGSLTPADMLKSTSGY